MKISELKSKSAEDLKKLLLEKRERLSELRYLLPQKKIKNVKEAGLIKKDVARILTLLNK